MPKYAPLDSRQAVLAYVHEQLSAAVDDPAHGWHWPAMSTGHESRVVVLRAYRAVAGELLWYTDRRSDKVQQLATDPTCGLLFYHAAHRTQLRLQASVREVRDETVRRARWDGVGQSARANYATAAAPGAPQPAATTDLPDGFPALDEAAVARAYGNFAIYACTYGRADFLQLLDVGAYRARWSGCDGWGFTFVTP